MRKLKITAHTNIWINFDVDRRRNNVMIKHDCMRVKHVEKFEYHICKFMQTKSVANH